MSPYPLDPVRAVGPMRLVLTTYPSRAAARRAVDSVLGRRLAACANFVPVESRYWWRGKLESAEESLVLFKTVPKQVGALLAFLERTHPYETPEVVEIDVPRGNDRYLAYLGSTLGASGAGPRVRTRPTRRGGRPGQAARAPGRTRAPRRPPSR